MILTPEPMIRGRRNGALGKKGERSPIFIWNDFGGLGGSWEPFGLRRALQVLVVRWWSFDQAAKINEKSMNHLVKNLRTISEKSTKNQPKIDQNSTKNPPKIDENRSPEGVWADSRSQARLGRRQGRFLVDF